MESADLALLMSLDALLQEGNVTRAAQRVGLSTPAMSHALARIRLRLEDPILVRAGRGMRLTPRAEALKPRIHALVTEAREVLAPARPFRAETLERSFQVLASDYVLTVLGPTVDTIFRARAPRVCLRFIPNGPDDPILLREGGADLAVGIYADLPQEMRSRQLLTDRFVCVARRGHPGLGGVLSLDKFIELPHIQIAPRGKPGGYVDDVLEAQGRRRVVARAVPYFMTALQWAAQTDYILTLSERLAQRWAPSLGLDIFEPPVALRPYALSLVWHPRFDGDPGHGLLREVLVAAAQQAAGDHHEAPRRRLDRPKKR